MGVGCIAIEPLDHPALAFQSIWCRHRIRTLGCFLASSTIEERCSLYC